MKKMLLSCLVAAALFGTAQADHSVAPLSENTLARNAELIFVGTVIDVDYARAESSDGDAPGIPHTFVTYRVEKVFKGKPTSEKLTLRFVGGRGEKSSFLMASNVPLFDVGEQDVLFVRGNGEYACPLVQCGRSRVRVINGLAYNDDGQALEQSPVQARLYEWSFGPYFELEEVISHKVSQTELRKNHELPPGETLQRPTTKSQYHLAFTTLTDRIAEAVRRVNTPDELAKLPPVYSADISRPFKVDLAREVAPPKDPGAEVQRTSITTSADKAEFDAVRRNGGNPVIK